MKKLSVIFAKIAFIGVNFFDGIFSVAAAGDAKGKIGTVMVGSGGHFRGEDEAVVDIDGGMLLKDEMRGVVLDRPVGIEIPGEFHNTPIFIEFSFRCFSFLYFFFQFFFADGMAGRLNQSGIDGYAFVNG